MVAVHIMVVADAPYVIDQVTAALGGSDVGFTLVTEGREVAGLLRERVPDVAVIDMQVGSMGGVAITMAARLDESVGKHARVPVVLLLDREADVYLTGRCDADAYLIKPINALHLTRTVREIVGGAPSRAQSAKRGRRTGDGSDDVTDAAGEEVAADAAG